MSLHVKWTKFFFLTKFFNFTRGQKAYESKERTFRFTREQKKFSSIVTCLLRESFFPFFLLDFIHQNDIVLVSVRIS